MVCLGGWVNSGTKISASTGRTPANISRRCRGLLLFLFVSSSPVSLSLSLIPLAPSTPIHLSPLSLFLSRLTLPSLSFPFLSTRPSGDLPKGVHPGPANCWNMHKGGHCSAGNDYFVHTRANVRRGFVLVASSVLEISDTRLEGGGGGWYRR